MSLVLLAGGDCDYSHHGESALVPHSSVKIGSSQLLYMSARNTEARPDWDPDVLITDFARVVV